jgi:predicted nucleotidyltransferase
MDQILYKNSNRLKRGRLQNFEHLPDFAKDSFKLIKNEILKFSKETIKVYVYGSFYWGFWCDESDFDIVITEKINDYEFKKFMSDTYNIKVDIFTFIPENELVEIP